MRQHAARLALGVVWVLSATSASAQNPFPYNAPAASYPYQGQAGQFQRPPILSPYLNLGNRNLPAVNYFNFVVPQFQANQQQGQFLGPPLPAYQPGDDVMIDPQDPTSRMPRSSAHQTTFNNTGGYFNSLGTIGSGFGRPGGQQQPAGGRRR